MANAFLQRLFGQKNRGSDARSLSITETVKSLVKPEISPTDVANQEERKSLESGPADTGVTTNVNSLFAFVDPKDPFTPGEIAGEQLPGPILSIMSAKQFRHLFLFHTPHTREHAVATEKEVSSRHPECQIVANELPVSDPKDYSSVMGRLARTVRRLKKLRSSEIAECYVCVSSGTAEMRAAWFLLAALGVLPAKMLQVGSPARPLFGEANVREVRMDSIDWQTILDLAMPEEYFHVGAREPGGRPPRFTVPLGMRGMFSWLRRGTKEVDDVAHLETPDAGQETVGFGKASAERMRTLHGDPLTEFFLPLLRDKLRSRNLPPDTIQDLTDETFGRLAASLRLRGGVRQPEQFATLAESVFNSVYLEYYRSTDRSTAETQPNQPTGEIHYAPLHLAKELKLTPEQWDALQRGMTGLDRAAEPSPLEAGEKIQALVSSGSRRPETLESKNEAREEAPTEQAPAEAGEETQETVLGGDRRLETPESQDGATAGPPEKVAVETPDAAAEEFAAAGKEEYELLGAPPRSKSLALGEPSDRVARDATAREMLAIPGLDEALRELGIFIGSAALRHAAEQAGIAAGSHLPILLLGETGTGKDRFAHLIHRLSPRFHRELVAVNCAAIPASLAESYLLGHVRGAFTGATSDGKGIFEAADQGTLFLDEIAELTLEVQAKLLRVINDGVVQRLGSTVSRRVDVRIIAASNRDLRKEVSAGRFREDLYFRLEVVQIKLPALRERRGEIPELALMLLRQINQLREKPRQLTTGALARLERQPWPGNVRDLLNVLERSVLYSRAEIIDAQDLKFTCDPPGKDPFVALPEPSDGFKVEEYLRQVRNQLFLRALEASKGNQTAAAEKLGVSKQAVSKFVQGQNDNEN
jgi:DNA-binding NtrC family response regulator